jgi:hypothetical protein
MKDTFADLIFNLSPETTPVAEGWALYRRARITKRRGGGCSLRAVKRRVARPLRGTFQGKLHQWAIGTFPATKPSGRIITGPVDIYPDTGIWKAT